jgi:hypothetical protein
MSKHQNILEEIKSILTKHQVIEEGLGAKIMGGIVGVGILPFKLTGLHTINNKVYTSAEYYSKSIGIDKKYLQNIFRLIFSKDSSEWSKDEIDKVLADISFFKKNKLSVKLKNELETFRKNNLEVFKNDQDFFDGMQKTSLGISYKSYMKNIDEIIKLVDK